MAQATEFDAALAKAERDGQAALAAVNANLSPADMDMLGASDNENVEVTDADFNDPALLAELGDLGYESDERGNENSDAKSNDSGDEKVFEELKANTIQLIIKKRGQIQSKAKQFQQSMDVTNAQKCKECDQQLLTLLTQINKLEPIEFATDKEEYEAKINKIMQNFGPLNALASQNNNTVNIQHNSKHKSSPSDIERQVKAIQKQKSQVALAVDSEIAKEEGSTGDRATVSILKERSQMYKLAAKKCLNNKNREEAMKYLKQSKEISAYIEPVNNGIVVWMEDIPPKLDASSYMIKPATKTQMQQERPKTPNKQNAVQLSDILDNADEPATAQMIRMRMDNYRIAAVQAKKDGKIDLAKMYLTEYKTMKEQLGHVEAGKLKITVGDLPRSINTGGAVVSRRDVLGVASGSSSRSKSPKSRDTSSSSSSNNSNNTATNTTNNTNNTRAHKPVPKQPPPSVTSSAVSTLTSEDSKEYTQLIKRLETQMTVCDSDSAFLAHDPAQAAELIKWKNETHIWLTKTLQCQKKQLKPPKYELVKIAFSVLKLNSDIKENEMRVIIKRFKNIQLKGTVSCFIEFRATHNDSQLFEIKGKTENKTGEFDCEFNYQKGCKIIRDHNLDKKMKYGRFEMQLFTVKKALFGSNKELIGSATIKLRPLLEKSTMEEDVTIKDVNTNKKIGELEVVIKLRSRVEKIDKRASKNKKEMVPVMQEKETVERVLVKVTEFPNSRGSVGGKQGQTQQKQQTQQQRKNSNSTKQQAAAAQARKTSLSQQKKQRLSQTGQAQVQTRAKGQSQSKPAAGGGQAAAKKASNLPKGVTEEMVENPLDPMWIESFEVMEKEQEYLTQQLAVSKGAAKEEIQDKIETIKLNLMTIQTQVQAGLLSIDQYTAKIQLCMQRDFALRKHLLTLGRNEEAKRVGVRVVLMKKELKGSG